MGFDWLAVARLIGGGLSLHTTAGLTVLADGKTRLSAAGDRDATAERLEMGPPPAHVPDAAAFEIFGSGFPLLVMQAENISASLAGDTVLVDLCGGSGWTGAAIAALFPGLPVVSILPSGSRFTLAEAAYWFPDGERPDNLVFACLDRFDPPAPGDLLLFELVPAQAVGRAAMPAASFWRPDGHGNGHRRLVVAPSDRLLVNPAWSIDSGRGQACAVDGQPRALSRAEIEAMYFGRRGDRVAEIAARTQTPAEVTGSAVASLVGDGVVLVAPWSSALVRLHAWWATGLLHVAPCRSTLAELWNRRLRLSPDRPALIGGDGETVSYAQLDRRVSALMDWFAGRGLGKADRVAIWSDPFLDLSAVFWAVARSGLVLVPISPETPSEGVAGMLDELRPKVLIADPGRRATLGDLFGAIWLATDVAGPESPDEPAEALQEILNRSPPVPPPQVPLGPEDLLLLVMTSGTTGVSKKLFKTHGAFLRDLAHHVRIVGAGVDDVVLASDALVNQTSMRATFGVPVCCGAASVVAPPPGPAQVIELWERMAETGVTVLVTLPSLLRHAVALAERKRLPRATALRAIHTTGAPLGDKLVVQAVRAFGIEVIDSYAATETGLVTGRSSNTPVPRRAGFNPVGVAWNAVIRIGDPDHAAATDEMGSIWVLSDSLGIGYLRDGRTVDGGLRPFGWHDTGDVGLRDSQGMVHVAGRRDGTINLASGQLVVPGSVEAVIQEHPAVVAAVVLPALDRLGGEAIAALVELDDSAGPSTGLANAIKARVRDRLGSAFRVEQITFVDAMPRTRSGKVDRSQVTAMLPAAGAD